MPPTTLIETLIGWNFNLSDFDHGFDQTSSVYTGTNQAVSRPAGGNASRRERSGQDDQAGSD